jgi:tetratricopeptide (TPR) repeat protein
MRQRTLGGLQTAIAELQSAVAVDPDWAPGHQALAEAFIVISMNEWLRPAEGIARAREEARIALALDPSLPLAHATVGMVAAFRDAEWDAAARHFLAAIDLDPACAMAWYWYGMVLMNRGRFEESNRRLQQAAALDPLSPMILANLGRPHLCAGDYEAAASYFRLAIELDPSLWLGYTFLGWALEASGHLAEALEQFERAAALSDGATVATASIVYAQARAGRVELAQRLLKALLAPAAPYVSPVRIARIHVALGNLDEAITWLDRAREDGALINNTYPRYDPAFRPLAGDPRFDSLLASRGI